MLKSLADYLVFSLMGLAPGSKAGEALNFFLYDTTKIFLLLATIIFVVAVIRSSFPPERTTRMFLINGSMWATPWPPCWGS